MVRIAVWLAGLFVVAGIGTQGAMASGGGSPASVELAQAARPLVSGERVRVKKLTRDMESAMQTLNKGGVAPFQDKAYTDKWRASVERYRTALKKYPQTDDPDVQAAAAKLAEFENMVAFGIREATKQTAELGDVQAILAGIEKALRENRAPGWMPAPFDETEARNWVQKAANAQKTAKSAIAEMQRIAPTANLPLTRGTVQQGAAYDKQDLDRLMNFANGNLRDVSEAVKQTGANLKTQFDAQDSELAYFRELDPDNEKHRMNAFLQEGSEARIYERLDRQLAFAKSVVAYQRAFGKEPTAVSAARVEEIAALRKAYAENRMKALGDSKLPEPKSEDDARMAVAKQILAEPSYEFGEHGPVVLTTKEIVERTKTVSRAEIKDVDVSLSGDITLSGTETTWNYAWEEFKFATPIKEDGGDDWYIWWITAKKYSSGWERTPIGEWVSGAATKGSLIPRKNF